MASAARLCFAVLLALLVGNINNASAATKARKREKPRRKIQQLEGPTDVPVWELGLNSVDLLYGDVLEKSQQYWSKTSNKMFPHAVLGYVTPWNKKGYWTAETFRSKYTHIAPVWYQLKFVQDQFELQGGHEVNETWVRALQAPHDGGAPGTKVLPRVIFELEPSQHVQLLVRGQDVVQLLVKECDLRGYDGLTLETWLSWQLINGLEDDKFRVSAISFVRFLASELQQTGRQLALVVVPALPGSYKAPHFKLEHFEALRDRVDFFSLMTYDWSGPEPRSNANAPLPWIKQNLQILLPDEEARRQWGHKILMGLALYGYDHAPGGQKEAVTGPQLLGLLHKHAPALHWNQEHSEHFFEYNGLHNKRVVYYPTPASVQQRLELAQEFGVGLSVWELGQGLNWFQDLL